MKTKTYIAKISGFFKNLKVKMYAAENTIFSLKKTRFNEKYSTTNKTSNSLVSLMYSEENNTLFI